MAAGCFARTYQAQSVLTASPGQLVLMLYDGALRFLGLAQAALESPADDPRRIETINANLIKAQNILHELRGGLDREAGGEVAVNLDRVYDYYIRRLREANLKKDVRPVIEVVRFLSELRDAWAEMLKRPGPAEPAVAGLRSVA